MTFLLYANWRIYGHTVKFCQAISTGTIVSRNVRPGLPRGWPSVLSLTWTYLLVKLSVWGRDVISALGSLPLVDSWILTAWCWKEPQRTLSLTVSSNRTGFPIISPKWIVPYLSTWSLATSQPCWRSGCHLSQFSLRARLRASSSHLSPPHPPGHSSSVIFVYNKHVVSWNPTSNSSLWPCAEKMASGKSLYSLEFHFFYGHRTLSFRFSYILT